MQEPSPLRERVVPIILALLALAALAMIAVAVYVILTA